MSQRNNLGPDMLGNWMDFEFYPQLDEKPLGEVWMWKWCDLWDRITLAAAQITDYRGEWEQPDHLGGHSNSAAGCGGLYHRWWWWRQWEAVRLYFFKALLMDWWAPFNKMGTLKERHVWGERGYEDFRLVELEVPIMYWSGELSWVCESWFREEIKAGVPNWRVIGL